MSKKKDVDQYVPSQTRYTEGKEGMPEGLSSGTAIPMSGLVEGEHVPIPGPGRLEGAPNEFYHEFPGGKGR